MCQPSHGEICITVEHAYHVTAYARIRKVHPDLAITDLMDGPVVAGWNTLVAASLDPETRDIPVILMSSNTDYLRNNHQYLTERGCDTLEKPFFPQQVVAKVTAAIG